MQISFGPRGSLQIDDALITYKNFSGEGTKYNRVGDRNFAVIIDNEDDANLLIEEGWNVRIKPAREEGDAPFMYLPVKVKFNDRGPRVQLETGSAINLLDEESISCLDHIDIECVDLNIRPYDWDVNGKNGRTAYLQGIHVYQVVDRFEERYNARMRNV